MVEIVKIGTAEIRLQDCMEYMCGLPDKAFDLAMVRGRYLSDMKLEDVL